MRSDIFDSGSLVTTSLIGGVCPNCGKKIIIEKEKDCTPGFRYTCYTLRSQSCDCEINVDYGNGEIKGGKI